MQSYALVTSSHQTRNFSAPAVEPQRVNWPSDLAKRVHRRMRNFPRNYEVKALVVEAGMNQAEWTVAASTFRKSLLSEPFKYFDDQTELLAFGRVTPCSLLHAIPSSREKVTNVFGMLLLFLGVSLGWDR